MKTTKPWQIEVATRPGLHDSVGEQARRTLTDLGVGDVDAVRAVRIYLVEGDLAADQAREVASGLLADPVTEVWSVEPPLLPEGFESAPALTVRRRTGVMDPAQQSITKALGDMQLPVRDVARATRYHVRAPLDQAALVELAGRSLANDTIEEVLPGSPVLGLHGTAGRTPFELRHVALRDATDEQLAAISADGGLSLSLAEMQTIRAHYRALGREPTDVELETLAQTWSEHCCHKTLTHPIELGDRRYENLLKETVFAATAELDRPWCVSVFVDNAGIIEFVPGWNVCFKVETHNHPSAIEPYGGAGTGIGGVIRDVLGTGLGALPIMATDVFCLGPLDLPADEVPAGALHPARVMHGVIGGVRDYGNRFGVPTLSGGLFFDPGYIGNPLVYAGCVGLLPADCSAKQPRTGDHILVLGGRTGRDGIHGATFSSAELTTESETTSSGAVQIGNPIEEKTLTEAVITARDERLFTAITDCGAGGLSSAVGEMGEELGAEVHLERVPLKYDGLTYDEIWISEAQERMVLAVPPENVERLLEVCRLEGVEATDIGTFTDTKRLVLNYDGTQVCDLEMAFVHDGLPRSVRRAEWTAPDIAETGLEMPASCGDVLLQILAAPNVASKEYVIRQYDHEVQGSSVLKPLVGIAGEGPGDAAVIRPIPDDPRGLAVACGLNPCYGRLDPYRMAANAIDEAVRNLVAVGADPARIAVLDNFSWGNTNRPEELGALVRAAEACRDVALAYGTPFISGKDSLNNEFRDGENLLVIPPTLLISGIGLVPDVSKVVSSDLKEPGNRLFVVGRTARELGGSHYHLVRDAEGGDVPAVDTDLATRVFAAMHAAISDGLVRTCHDCSEGGIAAALAESALGGGVGCEVTLDDLPGAADLRGDARLFSESATRFVVEVRPDDTEAFAARMGGLPVAENGAVFADIGEVTKGARLVVRNDGGTLVDLPIAQLRAAFGTLNRAHGHQPCHDHS